MKILHFIGLIFILLKSSFFIGQQTLEIQSDSLNKFIDLDPYVSYFIPEHYYTIDSILNNHPEFIKLELDQDNININTSNISKAGCWLKFTILNTSNFNLQFFFRTEQPAMIKRLYEINDNFYKEKISGISIVSSKRSYRHGKQERILIDILPNKKNTYYFYIKELMHGKINVPSSKIIPAKFVLDVNRESNYYIGIFIGIIFIILLTNLTLYWSTKEITYIYYCFYLLSSGILILSIYGTIFELFLPNQIWVTHPIILYGFSSLTIISYALFSSKYLEIEKLFVNWKKVLIFFIIFSVILIFFSYYVIVNSDLHSKLKILHIIWTLIVYISCTIPAFYKKNYHSRIYLIANLFLCLGLALTFFNVDQEHIGTSTNNFLMLSIICQVTTLSLGIGKKMSTLRKEKNEAQKKAMQQLEKKVDQRTSELNQKNNILEIKNKEINDSINYAKRIQDAILPGKGQLSSSFENNFVLYLPKDIVAGDFYWLEKTPNSNLLAVADCTGHGVPGAMVSVVCYNALNKAVKQFKIEDPALILDKTRELIIDAFSKNAIGIKDGMDISLINYHPPTKKLLFSGANNNLLLIRNNKIIEFKANKQPVGDSDHHTPFSNHKLSIKNNDIIYLYSDGYADQFGGEKDKKLKSKNFKTLLLKIHNLEMEKQKTELYTFFNNWKKNSEQLDDVCVIGIKF